MFVFLVEIEVVSTYWVVLGAGVEPELLLLVVVVVVEMRRPGGVLMLLWWWFRRWAVLLGRVHVHGLLLLPPECFFQVWGDMVYRHLFFPEKERDRER